MGPGNASLNFGFDALFNNFVRLQCLEVARLGLWQSCE